MNFHRPAVACCRISSHVPTRYERTVYRVIWSWGSLEFSKTLDRFNALSVFCFFHLKLQIRHQPSHPVSRSRLPPNKAAHRLHLEHHLFVINAIRRVTQTWTKIATDGFVITCVFERGQDAVENGLVYGGIIIYKSKFFIQLYTLT